MSRWHHLSHLKDPPKVRVGDYVMRGTILGYVGATGHAQGAHVHYEVMRNRPPSWRFYPRGYARAWVERNYQNPSPWIKDGFPAPYSYAGYSFLSWDGRAYHPGIDINSPNDYGKPVLAPTNGRVQFTEGVNFVRTAIGRFVPSVYNGGWGNHLWIEADEVNPGISVPS